jgi:hypothetical protein
MPTNSTRRGSDRRPPRYGLQDNAVVGFLGSFERWHDIGLIADIIPGSWRATRPRFLMAGATLHDLPPALREKFAAVGVASSSAESCRWPKRRCMWQRWTSR